MNILSVTDTAASRLDSMMAAQEPKPQAVLLSVNNTGCSGLSYDMKFLPQLSDAPPYADRVEAQGVTIVIDPKATMFLFGSTMDYRESALKSGFEFSNPNETGRCGCGESFTVASADKPV